MEHAVVLGITRFGAILERLSARNRIHALSAIENGHVPNGVVRALYIAKEYVHDLPIDAAYERALMREAIGALAGMSLDQRASWREEVGRAERAGKDA